VSSPTVRRVGHHHLSRHRRAALPHDQARAPRPRRPRRLTPGLKPVRRRCAGKRRAGNPTRAASTPHRSPGGTG